MRITCPHKRETSGGFFFSLFRHVKSKTALYGKQVKTTPTPTNNGQRYFGIQTRRNRIKLKRHSWTALVTNRIAATRSNYKVQSHRSFRCSLLISHLKGWTTSDVKCSIFLPFYRMFPATGRSQHTRAPSITTHVFSCTISFVYKSNDC